ncbi:MIP/aquaporin family protein [Bartonella sp. DGB2]|uniref:MIP/aquaporin family protein n=1 Tax=Bartonella sp. DGB2 TaxID=3388426 RepID=UPI00398FDCD9
MEKKQSLTYVCFGEFMGTFLFLVLGIGAVAAIKVAGASFGQWEISIVWGVSVALAVYVFSGISGAHLNPSVTVALALFGGFPKGRVLPYIVAQFLGAFVAAAVVYALYQNLFLEKTLITAGVFTTFPHANISFMQAFMTEFFITALLVGVVFGLVDENNGLARGALAPLLIGLMVAIIGSAFGPLTGFAMNAARDFGPRTFIYMMGWGSDVMTGGKDIPYCLIPLIAPVLGGCVGAGFYVKLFGGPLKQKKASA